MSDPLRFDELTWRGLLDLPRDRTLIFVPISPIEEHGPHLPLGCDLYDAEAFALETACAVAREQPDVRTVIYPRVPLGTDTFAYMGSVEIRQRVIRDVAIDIGRSLAREGFNHIVFMNGHGGPCHNVALEEAATRLRRRGIRAMAPFGAMVERLFLGEYNDRIEAHMKESGLPPLPLPLNRDFHAGAFETSLMLALRPELVTDERGELEPVSVDLFSIRPDTGRTAGRGLGYLGAPAAGSAELGRGLLELLGGEMAILCRRLLAGESIQRESRCRLYWVPIFWTERWVWAGVALSIALALCWRAAVF